MTATDASTYCYPVYGGGIDGYSPVRAHNIDVDINLINNLDYQFKFVFYNRDYNMHLFYGAMSLQIHWLTQNLI